MANTTTAIEEIQNVAGELCRQILNDDDAMRLLDDALRQIRHLIADNFAGIDKSNALSLEIGGVSLWNRAVGLKTRGVLQPVHNAKMRNLAFLMVSFANMGAVDEETLRKQILMGMKTGRSWLDAKNPEEAETVLTISNQCAQKLHSVMINKRNENSGGETVEKLRLDVDKDMFKLINYRAEVAVSLKKNEAALELVHMAKEMLYKFPREGSLLSMLCYNFGVETYQRKEYTDCIAWLKESFDLGKDAKHTVPKNQARTLRLLANAYIEADPANNLEKALNAVSLANTDHLHPAGLYLKLRILLTGQEKGPALTSVLEDIINHPECNLELGLSVLQLLKQHNRSNSTLDFHAKLMKKYEQSPESGKIIVSQLQALLQLHSAHPAKEFVEECITAHNTGRPMDMNTKKQLHIVFWEQAATAFESSNHGEALQWYNYSLSLLSPSEMSGANMAKLQRNRASCFLHLRQIDKAKETIQAAEKLGPEDVHTHFITYKIALAGNDHKTASSSLERMVCGVRGTQNISQSESFGLICLAAQTAIEQNCQQAACMALDFLITHSSDHLQVLTALRCLVRLRLAESDTHDSETLSSIVPHINTAYNKILVIRGQEIGQITHAQLQEEALWFMKIAWNLALKCEKDPFALKEFFSLCLKLLSLIPPDPTQLSRQKTCSLMAAAGCLQVSRIAKEELTKREALEEALHHVAEFKSIQRNLSNKCTQPEGSSCADTTDILLLLYEFEARVKLRDSGAEAVLERALSLPQPEAKTFEALAALAVEEPACDKGLSVRALKVAIRTHLQADNPDFQRCSKDIHSLIQLSLSIGQAGSRQEAFNYFQETVDIIDKKASGLYPEMEILWLMTKAWNCGIHFYSSADYSEAERWCSLSMGLRKHLTTMKSNYEDQMNSVYGEILARIEDKGQSVLEE